MDTKRIFINRIAETYLQKYAALGYALAKEYLRRAVSEDSALEQLVVTEVDEIIRSRLEETKP